jgi:hypothetical protein
MTIYYAEIATLLKTRPEEQPDYIPASPGIYWWIIDPTHFLRHPADLLQFCATPKAAQQSTVGPYNAVTLSTQSVPLRNSWHDRLSRLQQDAPHLLDQLATTLVYLQRPLYLGRTSALLRRIRNHMQPESHLRRKLQHNNIDYTSCGVVLLPMGQRRNQIDPDSEEPPHDDFDESPFYDPTLGDLSDDLDEATPETQDLLKATEAAAQRLAQPLLNDRQEN